MKKHLTPPGRGYAGKAAVCAALVAVAVALLCMSFHMPGMGSHMPTELRVALIVLAAAIAGRAIAVWWTPSAVQMAADAQWRIIAEFITSALLMVFGYALGAAIDHPQNHQVARLLVGFGFVVCVCVWFRFWCRRAASVLEREGLKAEVIRDTEAMLDAAIDRRVAALASASGAPRPASSVRRPLSAGTVGGIVAAAGMLWLSQRVSLWRIERQ